MPSACSDLEGGSGRQPWDVLRFLKTVAYFNELPTPDKVLANMLKQLNPQSPVESVVPVDLPPAPASAATIAKVPLTGIIMVTGATGGVGRRVVSRLLAAGKHVRALVRDLEKAKSMLSELPVAAGGKLELAAADVVQRQTLLPEMFEGVRAVVCCTAVKVTPKEGDTADRAKYYQGIKFYDPEVVGDTPEAVEYNGMVNLLDAAADSLGFEGGVQLLHHSGQSAARWGPLDDVVMGGVSSSGLELVTGAGEDGGAAWVFSGNVSTDNFGGFASVRTRNLDPPLDLSPYEGVELRLFGDGQRYKFIIRPDANWDGIAYCCSFDTQPGTWQTIRIPFADFFPVFRAKRVVGGQPLDPATISSIQIMLSKFEYDGQLNPSFRRGPFRLPFARISTYLPEGVAPRFVHVSSAGVTRPNRPGINVDQEPPAVKLNDALGGILTWKLAVARAHLFPSHLARGEDALRASGVPFAVVRPTALTEEPGGMPVELDQGDTVKGKISREDVADLCVALLSCPSATDTTFEIRSTVPFSQPWTLPDPARPPPPRDWAAVLAAARLRPGVTGRTVDGVYTGRQTEEEALEAAGATTSTTNSPSKPAAAPAAAG
ncbi:hypothetical protein VOLCADRAFT_89408 [Volvox carteri f. nagariensis]|uniref:NADH:ubiquinone oxidoreductase intermediate-associated protein 30 domain-containing protein n=1 Tax=Volvox carteri f. nagariensis TaxID=3068 RepID=D8TRL9_VOLCA|nr:uncharacterized protein VOLCADRAFT_89408 [Volvox carteri f. nagariensis]EFJ50015.1 hypothetical protein VOLCADRAFT_89408 [Volvox carteri f. nagariensis]|eukprot:XP_002949080.1 hypothetical protein VOLCADRAFT_89408 [Volvox carteri f. nagariensis]